MTSSTRVRRASLMRSESTGRRFESCWDHQIDDRQGSVRKAQSRIEERYLGWLRSGFKVARAKTEYGVSSDPLWTE